MRLRQILGTDLISTTRVQPHQPALPRMCVAPARASFDITLTVHDEQECESISYYIIVVLINQHPTHIISRPPADGQPGGGTTRKRRAEAAAEERKAAGAAGSKQRRREQRASGGDHRPLRAYSLDTQSDERTRD